jgi:hypothetical protein
VRRLSTGVNNLYTLAKKYKGFDPELPTGDPIGGGIDYGFYHSKNVYVRLKH